MKELRRSLIFTTAMAALALACQSGTGLLSTFSGFAQYTIVYSDSGPRSFTRATGGFYSFLNSDTHRWLSHTRNRISRARAALQRRRLTSA